MHHDAKEAAKWFRLAAKQGHAGAQCSLGIYFQEGTGELQDAKEAVKWFRLAASQGHAQAQFNLGHILSRGLPGVAINLQEGIKWLRAAATHGPADDFGAASVDELRELGVSIV